MSVVQETMMSLSGVYTLEEMDVVERGGYGAFESLAAPELIPVSLSYDTADPYAVKAKFMDDEVEQFIDRSDLFVGRTYEVGKGDVVVRPTPEEMPGGTVLVIHSNGKARIAVIQTDHLSYFLDKTAMQVPLGEETVDVDSILEKILNETEKE